MPKRFTISHKQYFAQKTKSFMLQDGIHCRFGENDRFCYVLEPK
jgi:hypothetical protein